MNAYGCELNLLLAWLGIALGIVSGMLLGMGFHQEGWLGGYNSLRRRLYRLGHISLFGLALLNLSFYFTVGHVELDTSTGALGSWGFALGALTMPVCCVVMAHWPRWHLLFAIPVGSLSVAVIAVLWGLMGKLL